MNVKVRMPKFGKKMRTKKYWLKELLLTILATSISIVLTFGTANLIDNHHKKVAQRKMAMMVIHDIDETIRQMEQVDSILREFRNLQFEILEGKYTESLEFANIMLSNYDPSYIKFAETTQRIFTSNVDTWSTIGKVDFIDNVSGCYILREEYKTEVIDAFHELVEPKDDHEILKLDDLLAIKSEYYVASVVSGYRHLIDELYECDGDMSEERLLYHLNEINKGENREVCPGFYPKRAGSESIIFHEYSNNSVNHDFLGTVVGFDEKTSLAQVQVRNVINKGDSIEALMPGKPNEVFKLEILTDKNGRDMDRAYRPMEIVTIKIPFKVAQKDILRRVSE
jgi:hypothetical protein